MQRSRKDTAMGIVGALLFAASLYLTANKMVEWGYLSDLFVMKDAVIAFLRPAMWLSLPLALGFALFCWYWGLCKHKFTHRGRIAAAISIGAALLFCVVTIVTAYAYLGTYVMPPQYL